LVKKKRKRSRAGHSAISGSRPRKPRPGELVEDEAASRQKILRGFENVGFSPDSPSQAELAGDVGKGQVISIRGAEARVEPEGGGEPIVAILRKSTRVPHPMSNPLVVGDFVKYLATTEPPNVLTEVLPRRTRLSRARRGDEQVICANVDFGVIVSSAKMPPFKPRLVDRYLLSLAQGGLEPVLVLNKVDLLGPGEAEELLAPYRGMSFPTVAVSAETGFGLEELAGILSRGTSVLFGQSGVGKTALLNRLAPGLELRTREVYGKGGKGRHTTSASTLYRFPFGGAVVDTPGVRSFDLHDPTEAALRGFFPEIFEVVRSCRFSNCAHRGDDGCAIPDALASGRIHPGRLESFLDLVSEIRGGA
jgi:ribosome biogenesis GTPase